jgi:dihydrofolate synthase / folylpolyglutamate synthase
VSTPGPTASPRAWLNGLELHGIKLGLSTIRAICGALGHPERAFTSVLIAGTNGKGSVAAMMSAALETAGHRTGRYTSPHLVRLEERFTIDGVQVSAAALDDALREVQHAVERLQADGVIDVHPTYFEVTTAAAFALFRRVEVRIAVLEVGLGGRFDATNVSDPSVVVITSIALDHQAHLGDTLAKIAFEKAGVVRPHRPVVIGELPADALDVVRAVSTERGADVIQAASDVEVACTTGSGLTSLTFETPVRRYGPLTLALRGRHQVGNALVAVRALETLDACGTPVGGDAIARGLVSAVWPARLSVHDRPGGRQLVVDGAHNPAGAAVLAEYLREEWPAGLPLVFGAMRDKETAAMLRELGRVARPLILTTAPGQRAAPAADLATKAAEVGIDNVLVEPKVAAALARGWREGPVLAVAGSLYLAGDVLAHEGIL